MNIVRLMLACVSISSRFQHLLLFHSAALCVRMCTCVLCLSHSFVHAPRTGAADPGLLPCCPCALCICFAHRYQRSAPSQSRLFCRGNEGRCNVSNISQFSLRTTLLWPTESPSHSILSPAFPSCAHLQQVPSEMSGQRREMLRNIVGGGVSYVMKPLGHKPAYSL